MFTYRDDKKIPHGYEHNTLYISTHTYTQIDIQNKKLIIYLKYSKNKQRKKNTSEMHKYIDNIQWHKHKSSRHSHIPTQTQQDYCK